MPHHDVINQQESKCLLERRRVDRCIQDPPRVDWLSAMPKLNVNAHEARDLASYLYAN
jgi:hypothetical protein